MPGPTKEEWPATSPCLSLFTALRSALDTVLVSHRSPALSMSLLTQGCCTPLPTKWSQTSTQVNWILLLSILLPFPISLSYDHVLALAGLSVWSALALPTFLLVDFQASISSPMYPWNRHHISTSISPLLKASDNQLFVHLIKLSPITLSVSEDQELAFLST